ncbi:MAG: hypothetical protein J7M24_05260, partial [Candidatus Latescibacteria bacterium]|nr:hypothetical protein [Candidatus Latescibacterota bacterium]
AITLFIAAKRDAVPGFEIFTVYPLLVAMVLFSLPLGAGALYFGINRFYAYIISIFLVLIPGQYLYSHEPSRVMFVGAVILLYGAYMLYRFIRTYPIASGEV